MYSCGPPHMDVQEWDDQHEPTYSSCVRTRDVTRRTCRRRWMIGRNGERRSGISAPAARHDDDDDENKAKNKLLLFSIQNDFLHNVLLKIVHRECITENQQLHHLFLLSPGAELCPYISSPQCLSKKKKSLFLRWVDNTRLPFYRQSILTPNFASRSSSPFFLSSSLQLITYSLVSVVVFVSKPTFMQQKFAYNVGLVSTYSTH